MRKDNKTPDWEKLATAAILRAKQLELELDRARDVERRLHLAIALFRWEPKKSRGGHPHKYSKEMICQISACMDDLIEASGRRMNAKIALGTVLRNNMESGYRAAPAAKCLYDTVMRYRREHRVA